MVLTAIAVLLLLRLLAIVKLSMVWTLIWEEDCLWRIHVIHFTNWGEVVVHRLIGRWLKLFGKGVWGLIGNYLLAHHRLVTFAATAWSFRVIWLFSTSGVRISYGTRDKLIGAKGLLQSLSFVLGNLSRSLLLICLEIHLNLIPILVLFKLLHLRLLTVWWCLILELVLLSKIDIIILRAILSVVHSYLCVVLCSILRI